ncbi:hypothetical protein XCR_1425 [Xanthomonas campestris pv. raphani 756C]|nr:hypothetical protein XCR_1425 [Xanthomonas campestris pv. raphani 756C]
MMPPRCHRACTLHRVRDGGMAAWRHGVCSQMHGVCAGLLISAHRSLTTV